MPARQREGKDAAMKKRNGSKPDELRREYDPEIFRRGVRGKYYKQAMAGTNLVLIEPDIASVFPDAEAVNGALRDLISVAESHASKRRKRNSNPSPGPAEAREENRPDHSPVANGIAAS